MKFLRKVAAVFTGVFAGIRVLWELVGVAAIFLLTPSDVAEIRASRLAEAALIVGILSSGLIGIATCRNFTWQGATYLAYQAIRLLFLLGSGSGSRAKPDSLPNDRHVFYDPGRDKVADESVPLYGSGRSVLVSRRIADLRRQMHFIHTRACPRMPARSLVGSIKT